MAVDQPHALYCCYINCDSLRPLDARIEVKTVLPKQGLGNLKSKFLIKWRPNGEADFHLACWEAVTELSRQRTKKSQTVSMCKEEKALVKAAAEAIEQYDSVEDVIEKAKQAAEWIRDAKHCVAFTGAGISTSAGIGDYRGKAGKWTEEDQNTVNMDEVFAEENQEPTAGKSSKSVAMKRAESQPEGEVEDEEEDGVPYEKLRPTYTHEALYKLMDTGHLKYVISQNGDGLHGLSGIAPDKISELHGNVFKEYCEKCSQSYDRNFYVMDDVGSQYFEEIEDYGRTAVKKPRHAKRCERCGLSHRTGRKCEKQGCNGYLRDTIINFRDLLDEDTLDHATHQSKQSDVMLCLGTTLQVTPACDLVKKMKANNKLIICNRQETPMDSQLDKKTKDGTRKGCRVFGDCDLFMREIMTHIYPKTELSDWDSKREDRLKHYDTLRD